MPYVKQTWVNDPAGGTPLSAARLNYLEDGVAAAETPDGAQAKATAARAAAEANVAATKGKPDGLATLGSNGRIPTNQLPDVDPNSAHTHSSLLSVADANATYLAYNLPIKFGAVGNGIADDTAALQACITAAVSNGFPVELGAYTYKISGPINATPGLGGIEVRGFGVKSKIVQYNLTSDFFTLGDGVTPAYNARFSDFAVTSASSQTAGWVFNGRLVGRCSWSRVAMQDAQDANAGKRIFSGIKLDGFDDCSITDCQIFAGTTAGASNVGVQANGRVDQSWGADLHIEGGSKIAGFNRAIYLGGGAGGVYVDETNIGVNNYSVWVDTSAVAITNRELFLGAQAILDSANFTNMYVTNNSLTHLDCVGTWIASAGQAADVTNGAGVNIGGQTATSVYNFSGCRIYNNGGFGVVINGQSRVIFDGCSVQYNAGLANGTTISGIAVLGTAACDLVVTNSHLHNNGGGGFGWGIYLSGSASLRAVINDNIFRDNVQGAMNPASLTTTLTARDNIGLLTSNSSNAQILSGSSFIDVTHGLYGTPGTVLVTPWNSDPADRFWVSAVGATTFRINLPAAAGANKAFFWRAVVGLGD